MIYDSITLGSLLSCSAIQGNFRLKYFHKDTSKLAFSFPSIIVVAIFVASSRFQQVQERIESGEKTNVRLIYTMRSGINE